MDLIKSFVGSVDLALMKQSYGDRGGQYRPRTKEELLAEIGPMSDEVLDEVYEFELFMWQ